MADHSSPLPLPRIQALAAADMASVDALIRTRLASDVVLINQVSEYIIGAGGKRLRPMLVVLAGQATAAGGRTGADHHQLAAIIEFIHTSTLLHDDVVDESDLRRGRSTANAIWGNAASVLVGDFLYSRSFQLMVELDRMEVMQVLADTTNRIAEGEVLQLLHVRNPDTDEAAYLRVIERKTAVLFAAGTRLGALASGADAATQQALYDYGMNLGYAFQIADDLLDAGTIVSTRGRLKGGDTSFSATRGDMMSGGPVVVLVDAGSASASEVLAGALRDHKRARIVGSRTFGKGSVQTLLPLDNGDAVKLTTARYYTPSGRSIQGVGIAPDVILHPEDASADDIARINEAALPGHLRGEEEGEAMAGENAGAVLPGDAPMRSALAELKRMAGEVPPLPAGKVPPITVEPAVPTTPLK